MVQGAPVIRGIDVGSFPLDADMKRYRIGARLLETDPLAEEEEALYFVSKHNEAFLAKAGAMGAATSVTSFAQSRGMITQFLEPLFSAVVRETTAEAEALITKSNAQIVAGAIAMGEVSLDAIPSRVAEIIALDRGADKLINVLGVDPISYKACLTGPLELTLNLQRLAGFPRGYDEILMEFFSDLLDRYVRSIHTKSKHLKLEVVSMDDPSFSLEGLGDFFNDTPTDDSLNHLKLCWNRVYKYVPRGCYRGLHIHSSPFEHLFEADWNLLEAHVGVYVNPFWITEYDKYIRAAIVKTDGPAFPKDADLKAAWNEIKAGQFKHYLQPAEEMRSILNEYVERYGSEGIPFAGPECGLGPWDWTNGADMALANLRTMRLVLEHQ
ncbi:MAG: hypothetical protein ACFFAY_10605 [Promethearchaeota archaeon]